MNKKNKGLKKMRSMEKAKNWGWRIVYDVIVMVIKEEQYKLGVEKGKLISCGVSRLDK